MSSFSPLIRLKYAFSFFLAQVLLFSSLLVSKVLYTSLLEWNMRSNGCILLGSKVGSYALL